MLPQTTANKHCPPRPHPHADARYRGRLSGTVYFDFFKIRPQLRAGLPLALHRERDHPFDPCAVAVMCGSHKLGYLPRSDNRTIARLLDAGARLEVRVAAMDKDPGLYGSGLEVTVREVRCVE